MDADKKRGDDEALKMGIRYHGEDCAPLLNAKSVRDVVMALHAARVAHCEAHGCSASGMDGPLSRLDLDAHALYLVCEHCGGTWYQITTDNRGGDDHENCERCNGMSGR